MKEMRTQNKIAWRSSVPKTVNTYSSVGTKLSKIVRQCPQLIIGGVSSVHAVPQSLYYPSLFLSCTLLLSIQYSLWLNCLIAVYLTQSCDFSSKLEKRICGLYAIEWMGKSVCISDTLLLWTGEMEHLHAVTYGYKGVMMLQQKQGIVLNLVQIACNLGNHNSIMQ